MIDYKNMSSEELIDEKMKLEQLFKNKINLIDHVYYSRKENILEVLWSVRKLSSIKHPYLNSIQSNQELCIKYNISSGLNWRNYIYILLINKSI
jgi:hypothetical protein